MTLNINRFFSLRIEKRRRLQNDRKIDININENGNFVS